MNECIAQIHSNFQPSKKEKTKPLSVEIYQQRPGPLTNDSTTLVWPPVASVMCTQSQPSNAFYFQALYLFHLLDAFALPSMPLYHLLTRQILRFYEMRTYFHNFMHAIHAIQMVCPRGGPRKLLGRVTKIKRKIEGSICKMKINFSNFIEAL